MEAASLVSPALPDRFFITSATWKAPTGCLEWPKINKIKTKRLNLTELVIGDNINKYFNLKNQNTISACFLESICVIQS